jgi:hypothetical protein
MYLIIGSEHDSFAHAVRTALERRHHRVVVDPNPFGDAARLRWQFTSTHSTASYSCGNSGRDERENALQGVFVRHFSGIQDGGDWTVDDLSYMRSESMAAVLAWLHALDCPVVGRVSDDGWYRPTRPLPEWVGVLADCELPTPRVVVTNVATPARHEHDWNGRAIYQPLTSARTYPIEGESWTELAKVMEHVPVCLTEKSDNGPHVVTFACGAVFWSEPIAPSLDRDRFESGVRRVADRLQADFIQLSYVRSEDGPTFTAVHVAPFVDRHSEVDQQAMADRIAEVLS